MIRVGRFFEGRTGRGVRVAVIDSGVHAEHPHVAGVDGGFRISGDGSVGEDYVDRLGHGTAVAAAIREKAPRVGLIAIKVFDRTLTTTATALGRAIEAAVERGVDLINLSLGTPIREREELLRAAVEGATKAGVGVVAAAPSEEDCWLPGGLPGVIGVALDWQCPRDAYRVVREPSGRCVFFASGYPREIPGVPKERNLKGQSFAVANLTGFAARALEGRGRIGSEELVAVLAEAATQGGRPPL